MAIDQTERVLQKIVKRLIDNYRPEQIILFGSMAYGMTNEDSDIDLLIIKETTDTPLLRRLRVRQIAADSPTEDSIFAARFNPRRIRTSSDIGRSFLSRDSSSGQGVVCPIMSQACLLTGLIKEIWISRLPKFC